MFLLLIIIIIIIIIITILRETVGTKEHLMLNCNVVDCST